MSSVDKNLGEGKVFFPLDMNQYREWVIEVPKLKQRIDELETENTSLKKKVDELTKELYELKKLKKENLRLKIISGEAQSGWKKDRDNIERDNPETGKLEQYPCPINFNHGRVSKKEYLDEHRIMVKFWHNDPIENHSQYYKMKTDAYLWLCGELPEQHEGEGLEQKLKFNDEQGIKDYLEQNGISLYRKPYMHDAIVFLLERKGKTFETKLFKGKCNMGSRTTATTYLYMFKKVNLVKLITDGYWKVNID